MAMFGRYEDWGLQAVVGASNNIEKMENIQGQCALGIWGLPQDDQNFILGFSDLIGKTSSSIGWGDGLETLYKPFYPVQDSIFTEIPSSLSPVSSFNSTPKEVKNEVQEDLIKQGTEQEVIKPKGNSQILDQSSSSVLATAYSPRFKRRKNQQKRVVTQVKAEDYLSSDMWAWRKYGQKPIKGSPYPRSYYRCSSMKGCQARKQVEQSCTDPEVYIVTYTAEHCHSQPTRRNSLAGTVRNKFPTTPKNPITAVAVGNNSPPLASNEEISSKSPPLNESSEEEISGRHVKQENTDEELRTMEWGYNSNGDPFSVSDFLMNDDFFSGLEDLDGPEL